MKTRTGTEESQLLVEKRTGTCNFIEGYAELYSSSASQMGANTASEFL
jgi:hypothetical protein